MAIPTSARGEGGRVVDTVTDHGDGQAARLERGDFGILVFGEDLGHHFVHSEVAPDRFRDLIARRR